MTPPMTVEINGFDEEGHLNGYLKGGDKNIIKYLS